MANVPRAILVLAVLSAASLGISQADDPTPAVVTAEPITIRVTPEKPIAGVPFSIDIESQLKYLVRLPEAKITVGDRVLTWRECVPGEAGRYHGSWPVPGTYCVEVAAQYAEAIATQDLSGNPTTVQVLREITVPCEIVLSGTGPAPEPPKPDPPGPSPIPTPSLGLRVLIVEETEQRRTLPPAQLMALSNPQVVAYLNSRCPKGEDGQTPEWRKLDQHADMKFASQFWRDGMARPRASLPWMVVTNGKEGYEGPLPADTSSLLDLLKKYGGP